MMSKKIVIDPVTRVEGHGKVTIHLDAEGDVKDAFFHIVEFRGFERFIQGHPYWEAPVLVQRLCGICPVSHHLAAAKAIDQIVGIDPNGLSPTATKIRRLLHYAQVFQSHALHFFYLASPDLLFGEETPAEERNVFFVAQADRELARKGILMRKFGQELIKDLAGKKIHGITAIPGGVHKKLDVTQRDFYLNEHKIPSIYTMIQWIQEVLDFIKQYSEEHAGWLNDFASYPSGHLGLVGKNGELELYDGLLRAIDAKGSTTLSDIQDTQYVNYFTEGVEKWSYMKFPYLTHIGRQHGWNRVGPLARINVCDSIPSPLAEEWRKTFFDFAGEAPVNRTMYSHWARLIEMLHCAELIKELLLDIDITKDDLLREGERRNEGIGIIEAPRGTLIHHYLVDDKGMITKCNLIVSTTHNNEAMNQAVKWVAKRELRNEKRVSDHMLNLVEVAIRAYDPCLSCATHAIGKMPLEITLFNESNETIDVKRKDA